MTQKVVNRLVRDKMLKLYAESGAMCVSEVLSQEQYAEELKRNLRETLVAFDNGNNTDNLVDAAELIYALAQAYGTDSERLDAHRREKKERLGGYESRLFLKSINTD